MEISKLEQLLEALVNGESVDITPSSRHEEYLLALLKGETVDKIPQSRLEVYLKKLCEIGLGDGTSVEAVLQALEVTKNGNYTPARGVDGFKSVTVNVPEPVLQPLNIIENGVYTPGDGIDGYSEITVNLLEQPTELIMDYTDVSGFASDADLGGLYAKVVMPETNGENYEFIIGDDYLVIWDGKPYVVTARDCSSLIPDSIYIGNGHNFGFYGNNEPFVIATYYGGSILVVSVADTNTSHSVKISKIVKPEPVLQDKIITENGIYTADEGYDGLGEVTVEISATGGEDYLEKKAIGTLTEYSNDRITEITASHAFEFCMSLSSISFPNLINITGKNAFAYCTGLSVISFPTVQSIGGYTFAYCSNITSANLPALISVSDSCHFVNCISLQKVSLPKLPVITSFMFKGCTSLTSVSFPAATRIDYAAFSSCTKLNAIRLMAPQVCALDGSSVFTGTGFTTTAGSIYVPSSLVSSYKTATNWAFFSKRIYGV